MTLSLRQRAALALTGAMVSAPLWGTAAAFASPTIVTFSGQPLLTGAVSCPSTPSVGSITVAPGATVNFADRLGVDATLYAGQSHTHLKNGQMVPVTFRAGPMNVQMQMLPDCTLDLGAHGAVTVIVTAAPAGPSGSGGSGTGGPATGSTRGAGAPPTGPKPSQSAHTPKPTRATPSEALPSDPALPGGALPGDNPTPSDGSDPFAKPATQEPQGSLAIGSPVASDEPSRGASGLLTLIATVSLVGVSAAAIRAIVAQRASRALTA
jgi:hypothetical protein